jgi:hypothetical protein
MVWVGVWEKENVERIERDIMMMSFCMVGVYWWILDTGCWILDAGYWII